MTTTDIPARMARPERSAPAPKRRPKREREGAASVSIALVWRAIFNDGGTVDNLFGTGGWVNKPGWALLAVALLTVWQFGAPMVIFLAGLQQIPAELYEAAAVDGAGKWRQFLSVTVPMLSPGLFFNLVLQTIQAF